MAKKKKNDRIPELVTASRLLLAVKMKATTGERAAAFLAAAAAELLSISGGGIDIAQHSERFATYLDQPEVKIGHAWGDALIDAGPLCAASVVMRLAKNISSSKELLKIDRKDFEAREEH
ncbi:MAG: hypothetical protein RI101_10160 [Nitrospira sp.]|nr:hypothetical protein [Nitrospira sp.]